MTHRSLTLALLCCLAGRFATAAEPAAATANAAPAMETASTPETARTVHGAVTRALPVIREGGMDWIEQRSCVSCHRVSFMTWALRSAARAGYEVDSAEIDGWEQWSVEALLQPREGQEKPAAAGNLEGVAQVLWAMRNQQKMPTAESRQQLLKHLLEAQQKEGTWPAKGQLPRQKRPPAETSLVSTMWIALALGTLAEAPGAAEARQRALAGIGPYREAASTEWYVARLLLAVQSSAREEQQQLVHRLLELQQPGGGWGWLIDGEADALATGMALYALRFAAVPAEQPGIQNGVQFLLRTQQASGSWQVPGTKTQAKGRPVETSTYWGTCWAVIGLLSLDVPQATTGLPPASADSSPAPTSPAAP